MKKIQISIAVLIMIFMCGLYEVTAEDVTLREWNTFAYEAVTVDATTGGVSLTSSIYIPADPRGGNVKAKGAFMRNEGAAIRYQVDGSTTVAAASNGMPILNGETFQVTSLSDLINFRAIKQGAVSSVLHVFYKR